MSHTCSFNSKSVCEPDGSHLAFTPYFSSLWVISLATLLSGNEAELYR